MMLSTPKLALSLALSLALPPAFAELPTEADLQPINCTWCEGWNRPQDPFRIHGRSWYVGTQGLAAVLIDSGDGLVLLDGALPQSAPQIRANIEALGFAIEQVRYIGNSHAHFDHAGGIAALARMSGAQVLAGRRGAEALRVGGVTDDDPQQGFGRAANAYPPVNTVRELADGEGLRLGNLELTRHATPGHTPGGSSWSWRSCEEQSCVTMVYADSLNAVSAPDFRFFTADAKPAPAGQQMQASIERIAQLDCDVLVAVHPGFSALFEQHRERSSPDDVSTFVRPGACARYAEEARGRLQQRSVQEQAGD